MAVKWLAKTGDSFNWRDTDFMLTFVALQAKKRIAEEKIVSFVSEFNVEVFLENSYTMWRLYKG